MPGMIALRRAGQISRKNSLPEAVGELYPHRGGFCDSRTGPTSLRPYLTLRELSLPVVMALRLIIAGTWCPPELQVTGDEMLNGFAGPPRPC